jgi:putative ABC transport system permease protein
LCLDQFTGILNVAAGVALLLVLLIAFNTASIGTDERSREHATMMAFGLPARTVLGMTPPNPSWSACSAP